MSINLKLTGEKEAWCVFHILSEGLSAFEGEQSKRADIAGPVLDRLRDQLAKIGSDWPTIRDRYNID